jgi:cytochrome c2
MKKAIKFIFPAILILAIIWLLVSPPRFWLNLTKRVDMNDPINAGATLVEKYDCRACHVIGGEGRSFGPNLEGVTRRTDPETLRLWLVKPNAVKSNTSMPNLQLSDQEVAAIMAYLADLDQGQ